MTLRATKAASGRGEALAIAAIVMLALLLRILEFSPLDLVHPDELLQYVAAGSRIATGHGIMPWEARYGVRNALIPQYLAIGFRLGDLISPGTLIGMYLARAMFAALTLLWLRAAWLLGALSSRQHALVALFVAATWWESILFSELLLSESLGAALILLAAPMLLKPKPEMDRTDPWRLMRPLVLAGALLGMGVLVRLQYAPFAAVLTAGALRLDWQRWRSVLLGALVAAAIGSCSDLLAGRLPFEWAFVNVRLNLGADIASQFGVSGPLSYIDWLNLHLAPFAPWVIIASAFAGRRYWPLLAAAFITIVLHSAIPHKEYRFIWIATLTLLLLAGIASVRLAGWIATRWTKVPVPSSHLGIKTLTCLCLVWALASLGSEHRSGGDRAYRGGAPIPRLAIKASARPQTCGIAIDPDFTNYIIPALLPARLPLLVTSFEKRGGLPVIHSDLASSANVLILHGPPAWSPATAAYHQIECQPIGNERACLYIRPGSCTAPNPYWQYQALLDRWTAANITPRIARTQR